MLRRDNWLYHDRRRTAGCRFLAAIAQYAISASCLASGPALDWVRQFGTPEIHPFGLDGEDIAGISLDASGTLYITGTTWGNLSGTNGGGSDVYLGKYDSSGNQIWMRQFAEPENQRTSGISLDGLGNVFITGWDEGGAFVSKHDADGNEIWHRQRGGYGASADGAGNVYASGTINDSETEDDALVTKFDAAGNELWSTQVGGDFWDQSTRVSADALGNVFAFGNIVGGGAQRSFLTKLDSDGNEYWTRELRAARYVSRGGVVADGLGNVYISGSANAPITMPRIHQGYDAFLAKYDAEGNQIWIREFGTGDFAELARGVTVDGLGNVFVAGTFDGPNVVDDDDAFLAKFNVDGEQLWIHQFGAVENDGANHVWPTG